MALDDATRQRITKEVTDNPVVLFMKGTPVFPMCGFSGRAIQILILAGFQAPDESGQTYKAKKKSKGNKI